MVSLRKVLEDSTHDYTGDGHFRVCARFCGAYFLIVTPSPKAEGSAVDQYIDVGIRVPKDVDVFGECPKSDRPKVATAYRSEMGRNRALLNLEPVVGRDEIRFSIVSADVPGFFGARTGEYFARGPVAIEILEWLARELKAEIRWFPKASSGRQEPDAKGECKIGGAYPGKNEFLSTSYDDAGSHHGHDYPVTGGPCKNGCNCRRWANAGGWRYWSPVDVDPGGACPLRPGQMPAHAYWHAANAAQLERLRLQFRLDELCLRYGAGTATPVSMAETIKLVEIVHELSEILTEGPRLTDPFSIKNSVETARQYQKLRAAVTEDLRARQQHLAGPPCWCPSHFMSTGHTIQCNRARELWELVK